MHPVLAPGVLEIPYGFGDPGFGRLVSVLVREGVALATGVTAGTAALWLWLRWRRIKR